MYKNNEIKNDKVIKKKKNCQVVKEGQKIEKL